MPFSSDVIEISDSDDDARPFRFSSQRSSRNQLAVVNLCDSDDDDDLPAPGDPGFLQGLKAAGKRKRHSSYSSSRSSAVDQQPYGVDAESSDEEEYPKKVPRKLSSAGKAPRKPRKTEEEKAAAKAQKAKAASDKKAQKAAEKEREKAEKAAKTARDKATKKSYLAANKLVIDKKTTLAKMEIVFPPALSTSPLLTAFRAHIAQFEMTVSVADANMVHRCNVFRWRRTISAEYDDVAREWVPLDLDQVKELDTSLVYMSAKELARCVRDEDGAKNVVRKVRDACPAGPRTQIFLMVEGLTAYFRRKGGLGSDPQYTKPQIEEALAALQLAENVHLLCVDTVADAVVRLYDLSADLGIKPYKLIQRSHLPFCSDTQPPTGINIAGTYVEMLKQIHRVTSPGAQGIARDFPTIRSLFEAYRAAPDARARDALVKDCKITHRKDGVAKERIVNQALSQVVGTVMYGLDPLQLAYKASKQGEREEE
ncbi:hypothetical protein K438DRAFT_2008531 [Mycena galopus ATCC 62051]|nr:hypothetical protein K438DRAFT_2008531 [Mycena galopus ATCC 62051]